MICKSYLIEENLNLLKNNTILFYGENIGLINDFKNKIKKHHKNYTILNFTQDEVLKSENLILSEIENTSLFGDKKIIFVLETTEKIYKFFENISIENINNKIIFFANELDKKSKLRNLFEKDKEKIIVPCYKDNDATIKRLISNNLKDYLGFNSELVEIIHNSCGNDRIKLNNEILKIKTFFSNKKLIKNELQKLLNLKEDNDFNLIRDASISGQKSTTNELLNSEIIEREKLAFYIASINQRLIRLKEVEGNNKYDAINNLKPPIFWKDKPIFLQQTKLWNKNKIDLALKKSYAVEIKIKSNINLNKEIIFKKFLVDICCIANAA